MEILHLETREFCEFVSLNRPIEDKLAERGVTDGVLLVYCPHTTAAITLNENGDPDVRRDLIRGLDILSPKRAEYRHFEGNSDAHLKASLVGASELVIVENGRLVLGTWQDVYFCEFDGPRRRKVYLKLLTSPQI